MTTQKYYDEIKTLTKFFPIYCGSHHKKQHLHTYILKYSDVERKYELLLCDECSGLFLYALDRLNECEYDIKPKCRVCKTRCYDKQRWKQMAKLMRFSGIRLGILKVKKMLKVGG